MYSRIVHGEVRGPDLTGWKNQNCKVVDCLVPHKIRIVPSLFPGQRLFKSIQLNLYSAKTIQYFSRRFTGPGPPFLMTQALGLTWNSLTAQCNMGNTRREKHTTYHFQSKLAREMHHFCVLSINRIGKNKSHLHRGQ